MDSGIFRNSGVEFLRRLRCGLVSLQPVLSGGIYAAPTKRHRENSVGDAYMRPENHVRTATGDALTVRKYPGLPSHGTAGPGGLLCNYSFMRPRRCTACPETPGSWGPHTPRSALCSSKSYRSAWYGHLRHFSRCTSFHSRPCGRIEDFASRSATSTISKQVAPFTCLFITGQKTVFI